MKQLNLDEIRGGGGFTPVTLVHKAIEWNGKKFDVWVKPASYARVIHSLVYTDDLERNARTIAEAIRDEDGDAIFTAADITGEADPERGALCEDLTLALLAAIGEVNAEKKTSLPPTMNSGTSSSSMESADEQSQKRKKE
jgi:hypothetical protein